MTQPQRVESLSHAQRERLAYIDFRLYFFSEIGRPDLIERFGVAPAGATRDLALYREIAPQNITFDGSNKIYRIGQAFSPLFDHASQRVLSALALGFGDGLNGATQPLLPCESPTALSNPIDTERALLAPERITQIVGYIREHFDQKTKRASTYRHDGKRLAGFNSLFACVSIDAAKRYYAEFVAQQKELPEAQRLKVGLIYSFAANEEESDGLLGEEDFETEGLDQGSRDFLDAAIQDCNALFSTSFDTSADKFQNYYKDLSQRLKKRELDIVIVVNMFLTGFDATTLNTLWAART